MNPLKIQKKIYQNLKKGTVKQGSLFEPWKDQYFDIVINDISAISSAVSNISPWFKNIPCKAGRDGTDLTIKFLKFI